MSCYLCVFWGQINLFSFFLFILYFQINLYVIFILIKIYGNEGQFFLWKLCQCKTSRVSTMTSRFGTFRVRVSLTLFRFILFWCQWLDNCTKYVKRWRAIFYLKVIFRHVTWFEVNTDRTIEVNEKTIVTRLYQTLYKMSKQKTSY